MGCISTQLASSHALAVPLKEFVIKDLEQVSKFVEMRVACDEDNGYDLDQTVKILERLRDHGMEQARGVRTPIDPEWNEVRGGGMEKLPVAGGDDVVTVKRFQSLSLRTCRCGYARNLFLPTSYATTGTNGPPVAAYTKPSSIPELFDHRARRPVPSEPRLRSPFP
ncbi:unnamed protein product [Phytophthora fragariaefolia]|uniref:Unnamed protein product n=1 Tax=Phytophthora fragariaefolia TaxID=1490495 RepID=A0A9W6UA92_9STRA|nr:unnamed protein product [Phytophthora fragariaefolia]